MVLGWPPPAPLLSRWLFPSIHQPWRSRLFERRVSRSLRAPAALAKIEVLRLLRAGSPQQPQHFYCKAVHGRMARWAGRPFAMLRVTCEGVALRQRDVAVGETFRYAQGDIREQQSGPRARRTLAKDDFRETLSAS